MSRQQAHENAFCGEQQEGHGSQAAQPPAMQPRARFAGETGRRTTMKRIAAVVVGVALALVGTAWAMNAHYSAGATGLAATENNLNTAFTDNHSGGTSSAFNVRHVLIRNKGAKTVHFDLGDGVATTSDTPLAAGDSVSLDYDGSYTGGDGWARIGLICAAGESTTVQVDAWR